jgi:apolipoprotein N-acyltransferase
LRYALLQGNDVNRDLTDEEFFGSPSTGFENLLVYNHFELAASLEGEYDLIVFPESSFPDAPNAPDVDDFPLARWPEQLGDVARAHNSYVLANGAGDAPDGRARNLNVLWSPDGEIVGEYAKRHLVPFGEWVPWRSTIERFVDAIDQIPRDFASGTSPGRFEIRGTPIATIICFESMFGAEVRPLVRDGAELIVVSTNNRSYRRSSNSEQHLAAAQIRAVETGRPVLQASVSGITGVVEADGRVIATQPLFENGIVSGTISTRGGMTPYVRFGDWVLWGSAVTTGLALVFVFARRRSVDSTADE